MWAGWMVQQMADWKAMIKAVQSDRPLVELMVVRKAEHWAALKAESMVQRTVGALAAMLVVWRAAQKVDSLGFL
jgi:hypothetical protein